MDLIEGAFLAVSYDAYAWLEGVGFLLLHQLDCLLALPLELLGALVVHAALASTLGRADVAHGEADTVALETARLVTAALGGLALFLLLSFAALAATGRLASGRGFQLVEGLVDEFAE
eukprot:scaffold50749_cov25-Tisochrysis_lutea.AAC.3